MDKRYVYYDQDDDGEKDDHSSMTIIIEYHEGEAKISKRMAIIGKDTHSYHEVKKVRV